MRQRWILFGALAFLFCVLQIGVFGYGIAVQRYKVGPYDRLDEVEASFVTMLRDLANVPPWYYPKTDRSEKVVDLREDRQADGLNLVTTVIKDDQLAIQVVDMAGVVVHDWLVDWFTIFPEASHLADRERPKAKPGGHIHGALLMPDGDVVFNFDGLGMARLDPEGEVVWKLAHRTHHALVQDEQGFLWAPAMQFYAEEGDERFPMLEPPYYESTIVRIDPQTGEVLEEISVFDLLVENDLQALLYMYRQNPKKTVGGDILHLNDIDIFPASMVPGVFKPGDIMLSLRNVNAIIVFDPVTRSIRHQWIAEHFVNQHDPDFLDGDRISIYDNNSIDTPAGEANSRILIADARNSTMKVHYAGGANGAPRFFNAIMGKAQWVEEGHLLITDSYGGRGFQIDQAGKTVWEYVNLTAEGRVGLVSEVTRLPSWANEVFVGATATADPAP